MNVIRGLESEMACISRTKVKMKKSSDIADVHSATVLVK